jgi:hypothetical protein
VAVLDISLQETVSGDAKLLQQLTLDNTHHQLAPANRKDVLNSSGCMDPTQSFEAGLHIKDSPFQLHYSPL